MSFATVQLGQIPHRLRGYVRMGWLLVVFLVLGLYIASQPLYYESLLYPCVGEGCSPLALNFVDVKILQSLDLSLTFYARYQALLEVGSAIIYLVLAGIVFLRRSDTLMGIIISLTVALMGLFILSPTPSLLLLEYPRLLFPFSILEGFSFILFMLVLLMFPDGRFIPPWTRKTVWAFLVVPVINFFLITNQDPGVPGSDLADLPLVLMLILLSAGMFAQIYRYRRISTPSQKQQTKWVVFGLSATIIVVISWVFVSNFFSDQFAPIRLYYDLAQGILVPLALSFPVSMVISIMRYRLWEIDLIIRRTLQYAILTGVLALLYYGGVVLLQAAVGNLTGQESSPIVVVLSTLAIAALFNPLRTRIQDFIDRRFYRRKYDAEQALARFAASARDEVDISHLAGALLVTVEETVQPEQADLWLLEKESSR